MEAAEGVSNNPMSNIPVIENIHQKVLDAASQPGLFDMGNWHTQTSCGTTHCRAGWVVELAGEKGKALEKQTSTPFAAMQIYHKSQPNIPVSPTRFYESNDVAMADMQRCSEAEKQLKKQNDKQ